MRKIRAFTLIELLVVIAIIGILSALIIVGMSSTTDRATIAKAQVFSNSLRNSLLDNLISEWKFDGNANDSWKGVNNGTWYGAGGGTNLVANYRPVAECVSGQCLNFDGTDDYVDVGMTTFDVSKSFSILFWFKVNNHDTTGDIVSKQIGGYYGSEVGIRIDTNKHIGVTLGNGVDGYYGSANSNLLYEADKYHQITLTANGNNLSLYKNGKLDKNWTTSAFYVSNSKISIGRRGENSAGYFHGLIDDVKIFNAAIPTSQIEQNYFAGLNRLLAKNQVSGEEYTQRVAELEAGFAKNR